MSLAKDARLKQLMVYRLEEQLRVIKLSPDDIYSRILASLSRCVQSLLVHKKEQGHDGSGDATTVNPFAILDDLLVNAPRGDHQPPKEKLLLLLADSLTVVFSTIDGLKPVPVSRSYIESVVDEELAREKSIGARNMSNGSNANAQFTGSTFTDVHSDTVSGVNSYASSPAASPAFTAPTTDQQWAHEQHTPATMPVENIGIKSNQPPSSGFGSQAAGFGSESRPTPFSADSGNQNFGGATGAHSGSTFGAGSQSNTVASEGPLSTPLPQSQTGFGSGGAYENRSAPLANASQQSAPSFGTQARKIPVNMPVQEAVVGISFGTKSKEVPLQPAQFNKPAGSFEEQQPAPMQQHQFQTPQSSEFGGHQQPFNQIPMASQPEFGTQDVQQQFNQAPVQQTNATPFGTQPNTLPSAQPQSMQQTAPSFGTQSHMPQQFNQAHVQQPSVTPAFGTQPSNLPAAYNQQYQVPQAQQPAPTFGGQQHSAPMHQQPAQMQGQFQTNAQFGSSTASTVTPQTESSQLTASSEMMTSTTETDGGSGAKGDHSYRLPVKRHVEELPEVTINPNQPELTIYDWSDYNPGPSSFGKHVIPETRGGYGGGGRGGGGFRGGAPRGGVAPRGGYGGRGRGQ